MDAAGPMGEAGDEVSEGETVTDPGRPGDRRVDQRCEVLLRLAEAEGERGHRVEARDLLAAAACEAWRSDRPDLLLVVRRACVGANRRRTVRLAPARSGATQPD